MTIRVVAFLFLQGFFYRTLGQSFDAAEVAQRITPSVVLVTGLTEEGRVLGSGFVVSSDGKIVTNLHLIKSLRSGGVQLATGEKFDSFSVVAVDERKDIAIIKIAGFDLPTANLGNSNAVQLGEPVLTMGSPLGLQGSVTTGVVSSIRDDPFGGGFNMIQTDASVNPGNSGGPLVNKKGDVVGVIRYKIGGTENLNFAVPINYVRGLLDGPLTAMSLDELRAKLANKTDVFQKGEAFPPRWKSLATGTIKIIRRDGDRIYIETVLPDVAKQAGCFSLADLHQQADTYLGTNKFSCVCKYQKFKLGMGYQVLANRYSGEEPLEITKISSTRSEGTARTRPQGTKFDCEKGTYSNPTVPQPFVWIPE